MERLEEGGGLDDASAGMGAVVARNSAQNAAIFHYLARLGALRQRALPTLAHLRAMSLAVIFIIGCDIDSAGRANTGASVGRNPRSSTTPAPPILRTREIENAAFSPDAKFIVTADSHFDIAVWDAAGRQETPFRGGLPIKPESWHIGAVSKHFGFSSDSTAVFVVVKDKGKKNFLVKCLTLRNARELSSFPVPDETWYHFLPGGRRLLVISRGGIARIYALPSGELVKRYHIAERLDLLTVSPDGTRGLFAQGNEKAEEIRLDSGDVLHVLADRRMNSPAYSPKGDAILFRDQAYYVWDLGSGKVVPPAEAMESARAEYKTGDVPYDGFLYSPNGKLLAARARQPGGYFSEVVLLEPLTGRERARTDLKGAMVKHLAYSADSKWVLIAGGLARPPIAEDWDNRILKIWDVETGGPLRTLSYPDVREKKR